jgi:hypothetical protein
LLQKHFLCFCCRTGHREKHRRLERLTGPFPVCGDKQGRAGQRGQGSRCGGPGEVPFLLKKSLGKTGGLASNQTKIQFFLKIIFIIEHIKKTRIFLKKK